MAHEDHDGDSYGPFLPRQVLPLLGKGAVSDLRLGDHLELSLTILFSDIRGFTSLSEDLTPKDNFDFINDYFGLMGLAIKENRGFIDKFIGDAIMALFPTGPDDAVDCGIAMLSSLGGFNETRAARGRPPIEIGVGLNTGISMLGIIGGGERLEATVISDAVNVAARMESLTKEYRAPLLISEPCLHNLAHRGRFHYRFLDRVLVKGKAKALSVFEVFDGDPGPVQEAKAATRQAFEEAVADYHYREIDEAKRLFLRCLKTEPRDRPAALYLERCDEYLATGRHHAALELSERVEWSEDFSLGIKEIDEQHQELFAASNRLIDSVRNHEDRVEAIMSFLGEYAEKHFSTEERYMEESAYPFLGEQREQHRKFIDCFLELQKEVAQSSFAVTYRLFRIQVFLVDWLVNHTIKEDMHYGRFMARRKSP